MQVRTRVRKCFGQDLTGAILEVKNMPTQKYETLGQNAKVGALDFDFKVLSKKLMDLIESVRLED